MNFRNVAYWVTTGIIVLETSVGAFWDLFRIPFVQGVFDHLGYPHYLLTIMGIWKLPGAVVLILPGLPRLKEWAYAGVFFIYSGAAASHLAAGDGPAQWAVVLVFCGIVAASWALRPASRRLSAGVDGAAPKPKMSAAVAYWVITGLVTLSLLSGGITELGRQKDAMAGMALLGYPVFFATILGVWKLLGGVALLAPRSGLIKEWAYAGIVFDLTGASASHAFSADYGPGGFHIYVPLLAAGLAIASWALRPPSRWYGPAALSRKA